MAVQGGHTNLAEAAVATPAWVLLAYLVAGVCFILALRGLSSPVSSRRGNRFGMFGMALALVTTLVHYRPFLPGGAGDEQGQGGQQALHRGYSAIRPASVSSERL